MWTLIPVPAFIFVWLGAKPRTPTTDFFGFTWLSQSEIFIDFFFNDIARYFYSHGEGLSREPWAESTIMFHGLHNLVIDISPSIWLGSYLAMNLFLYSWGST